MWRIVIGAIMTGIGAFLVSESMGLYGDSILLVIGTPLTIVGSALVAKGDKTYLTND